MTTQGSKMGGMNRLLSGNLRPSTPSVNSLLGQDIPEELNLIPIDKIRPSPFQPRRYFDPELLDTLRRSVIEHGILSPLWVRMVDGAPELIAGERRLRAAELAGLTEVPVKILVLGDLEALEVCMAENLDREDLSVYEQVQAVVQLLSQRLGLSKRELVTQLFALRERPQSNPALADALDAVLSRHALGNAATFISSKLSVLRWPAVLLQALDASTLGYTQAKILYTLRDHPEFEATVTQCAKERWTTAILRMRVRALKGKEKVHSPLLETLRSFQSSIDPHDHALLEQLAPHLKAIEALIKLAAASKAPTGDVDGSSPEGPGVLNSRAKVSADAS